MKKKKPEKKLTMGDDPNKKEARKPQGKHEKIIANKQKEVSLAMTRMMQKRGTPADITCLLYCLADKEGMWIKDVVKNEDLLAKSKLTTDMLTDEIVVKAKHMESTTNREILDRIKDFNRRIETHNRIISGEGAVVEEDDNLVAAKPKPVKAEKVAKKKKAPAGKDAWGCANGSQASVINTVLLDSKKPLSIDAMCKADAIVDAGLDKGRVKGHLKFLVAKNFVKQVGKVFNDASFQKVK
jgi:hypothetical protein